MSKSIAVVIGLCAHGLAIARALAGAGITVVAFETNKLLPGFRTNVAEIIVVDDINGAGLIDALVAYVQSAGHAAPPVLYLTNDTMIKTVGEAYNKVANLYRLSWGPSRAAILPLLRKNAVGERCTFVGLRYPQSKTINKKSDTDPEEMDLKLPVIFKPDTPVSSYKVVVVKNTIELQTAWTTIENCLPSIAQEFIPGDDTKIYFAALYLNKGEVVSRFEGRKLRSRPMGHTTVAISERNDHIHRLACQFFAGLNLSGPASLEVKKDPDENYWVIEPTIGRTDFWLGLCIKDGVNLPLIEYLVENQLDIQIPEQRNRTLWLNGERDPAALLWVIFRHPRHFFRTQITGVYLNAGDRRPWISWTLTALRQFPRRVTHKLLKILRVKPNAA